MSALNNASAPAHPARLIACGAHRIRGAGHPLSKESGLGLDELDQRLATVGSLPSEAGEDGGEEVRRPDGRHLRLLSELGAPAALGCDTPSRRRVGLDARGCARGPIRSHAFHDHACQGTDRHERPVLLAEFLPAHLGLAGSRRQVARIHARRGTSAKIIRCEPHRSVSKVHLRRDQDGTSEVDCGGKSIRVRGKEIHARGRKFRGPEGR